MVETKLTCHHCGEHFETKSDLQDHEANCLGAAQNQGQKQQQSGKAPPASGRQQQTTGNRARGAGGGESWNDENPPICPIRTRRGSPAISVSCGLPAPATGLSNRGSDYFR